MSNYEGNPASYPVSIPRLADQSSPQAADIDVPLEALADRTANTRALANDIDTRTARVPALNFRPSAPSSVYENHALFDLAKRSWFVVGDLEQVRETFDMGAVWSSTSHVAAVGSNENCLHGNCDSAGNIVVTTDTRYAFQRTGSTGAWTKVDVLGAAPSVVHYARVVFDPVRSLWVWMEMDQATNVCTVKTSSNRTAWTAAAAPAGFGDVASHARLEANPSTGRILAVGRDDVGASINILVRTSDNAGTSWTNRTGPTASVVWDRLWLAKGVDAQEWIITLGHTTAHTSEVWRSTDDGVTWTRVSVLANGAITSLATLGKLWVARVDKAGLWNDDGHVAMSLDGGATWRWTGHKFTFPREIYAAAGGFLITGGGVAYFGDRVGAPDLGVLT